MTYLLITLAILTGIFRGIKEGMVMIVPPDKMFGNYHLWGGVRCHRWFADYHNIGLLKLCFVMFWAILNARHDSSFLFLCAQLMIIWQFTENLYWYAREKTFFGDTELIAFGDILRYRLNGWQVKAVHIFRIVVIIILLIWP